MRASKPVSVASAGTSPWWSPRPTNSTCGSISGIVLSWQGCGSSCPGLSFLGPGCENNNITSPQASPSDFWGWKRSLCDLLRCQDVWVGLLKTLSHVTLLGQLLCAKPLFSTETLRYHAHAQYRKSASCSQGHENVGFLRLGGTYHIQSAVTFKCQVLLQYCLLKVFFFLT